MKFKAKKIDLTLEITTANGEEVILEPTVKTITGTYAERSISSLLEIENVAIKEKKTLLQTKSEQLSLVYGNEPSFWLDALDPISINEVHDYVFSQIRGAIKKEKN